MKTVAEETDFGRIGSCAFSQRRAGTSLFRTHPLQTGIHGIYGLDRLADAGKPIAEVSMMFHEQRRLSQKKVECCLCRGLRIPPAKEREIGKSINGHIQ